MSSPVWALLKRELATTFRGRGAFALLAVVVAICVVIVALLWPDPGMSRLFAAIQVRRLFRMFCRVHLLVATLLPPGLAVLAFAEDCRQDTLDQLRLSLLTTSGLIGAKLLAVVAVFALIFAATLPCLGAQLLLVGISTGEALWFIAITLSTMVLGAAAGLLCALVFRHPALAFFMSYVAMFIAIAGWISILVMPSWLISLLFLDGDYKLGFSTFPGLHAAGKVHAAGIDLYLSGFNGSPNIAREAWGVAASRLVAAGVFLLGAVRFGFRTFEINAPPVGKPIDDPAALRARKVRFPFYLIDPLRRRPAISERANPVLAREWRCSLHRGPQGFVLVFFLAAIAFTLFSFAAAWTNPHSQWLYEDELRKVLFLEIAIILAFVQISAAGGIACEYEQKSVDLLRVSLLSPASIFWGQFLGGTLGALPCLAGATVAFLASMALVPFGVGAVPILLGGFATLLTCVWLMLCISCFVNSFVKSGAAAMATGVLANLLVYLWPYVGIAWCENALYWRDRYLREILFERLSPLTAFQAFRLRFTSGPWTGQATPFSVEGDLYLVLALFVAIGLLLLLKGKSRFERDFLSQRQ